MLLSNNDIKRELIKAKNLAIYPLKVENIKGSSINLTASKYAWNISDKKSAVTENDKKIVIPPNSTVCIFTEEAVWVSRRIGGTYHPRVSLVSKGLGNISTTLDPQWYGLSLVAVNNPTSNTVEIKVGEAFVSVMLYYLKTPATKGIIENQASRPDIYSRFTISDDEEIFLAEQWHRNHHGIVTKMLNSESYQYLYKDKMKFLTSISNFFGHNFIAGVLGGLITTIIGGIIIYYLGMN
ncbi:hypothetical protein ACFWGC_27570 [Cytobacillus pseudoceanisediminis]|uniref:dUTPase-like domain-containing protein n=1 Tax=Cytobacillus oceanisediminis TaxID=665099 RepID=A0ABX3CYD7_9BACI|nr:hypothetical protein [Cytobacillus oceanisediminis]OHX49946.1 hypothetical protein BBV17_10655 [Cytobacillus oceanisediminis]